MDSTSRELPDAFGLAAGYCEIVQYPGERENGTRLPDLRGLRIRPLHEGDSDAIREFCRHLSPRTQYLRFSSQLPDPPDLVLPFITPMDDYRRLALLAESDAADGAQIVALSQFAAIDDITAEVALVVQDGWQRLGLGAALATLTLLAAEARGFNRFVAHVLCDNVGAMRLLDRVGSVLSMSVRRGTAELTFVRRGYESGMIRDTPLEP
jgi:RimJ/RimL family protein N-acetyltransferase